MHPIWASSSPGTWLLSLLVSVLPVVVYLLALTALDSYKLVRLRSLLVVILAGSAAALLSRFLNLRLLDWLGLEVTSYSRYVGPIVEEVVKASYIVFLIRSKRIGFAVDAAILGFAMGTGFAIIENLAYLIQLPEAGLALWVLRGFGTAIMHGGAAALFASVSQGLSERRSSEGPLVYLPGLLLAIAVHSLYNHFLVSPVLSAIALVLGLPLIMVVVFQQSESSLRKWLDVGFDSDAQLFEMIRSGKILQTRIGAYLISVKKRFSGVMAADMLCMLRLHVELSLRVRGELLMRETGLRIPPDPEVPDKFAELKYLEKRVGRAGLMALMPLLRWSRRDMTRMYSLGRN
jgi:RsiW-degrading membrane proteinase PrsW (M82 family)